MRRTRLIENGRINYSISYKQFEMQIFDDAGSSRMQLFHEEKVKYFEFPFKFGEETQLALCNDTGAYYRN